MPDSRTPQQTADAVREAKLANDTVLRTLGIEVGAVGPGRATVVMTVRADMLNGFVSVVLMHRTIQTLSMEAMLAIGLNIGTSTQGQVPNYDWSSIATSSRKKMWHGKSQQ